jgi:hypothetical protein
MNKPFRNADSGVMIYPELPENMRVATKDDFVDTRGVEIVDLPFLAKSFHNNNRFELHKSKAGTVEKWKEWIDAKHIFIKQ